MTSEERKARNEALFRDANEEIEAVREQLSLADGRTPFICECEDTSCRTVVRLTLAEYEAIRARPTRFFVAAGHIDSTGRVVDDRGAYRIVEKEGAARAVAEALDPRGARDG